MLYDYPLLEALAAVVREGTFDAAARSLNVTQSAVSQRIKLLEEKAGAVLVVRGRPCVATEYGQRLYQHLEQVLLLEHDLRESLTSIEDPGSGIPTAVRIAVNSDSLATWFPEVVKRAEAELNISLEIFPDDEVYTAEKLRSGEALAAVTSETSALPGHQHVPLGAFEYLAIASPEYVAKAFPQGITLNSIVKTRPLAFNRKDLLPQQWMQVAFGETMPRLGHMVPSVSGLLACCLKGVAWGMMPRLSVSAHLESGRLQELVPGASVIVPLFWQSSGPRSEIMKVLSRIVAQVATEQLDALPADSGGHAASVV
jgi:LysR family transcriptional regulator (chromosome initiation inhibitor)